MENEGMRWMAVLVTLAGTAMSAQKFATRGPNAEFIGAWKLVSYERTSPAGEMSYPMGQNPMGRIAYDPEGRMYAQLMRADRPKFQSPGGASEEKAAAYDSFVAYYGSYTVNPADHSVVHHVESSLNPNWLGADLTRSYEFSEGRLILRAKSPNGNIKLIWERAR